MFTRFNDLLFNTSNYMPHGFCYLWRPKILWLHVISDSIIAIAYFSIPFALWYFVHKRVDLAYRWVFVLFGVFILLCGTTHLMSIWTIWHPDYLLEGGIKFATAIISIATALLIWPLIPQLLQLPSPQALKSSEAFIRAIFNATPDAMLIKNEKGIITMVNRQAEILLGYPAQSLIGQSMEILVPERFRAGLSFIKDQLITSPSSEAISSVREIRVLKNDSSEIDVDISLSPIITDQGLFIASAMRDITFKKQAELELRIAATAFEAHESMLITDADSVILQVNQAFLESTGYQAEEVVGQKMNLLKSGLHDELFYEAMWKSIEEKGSWQGEIWDRRKNGEIFLNWATITAVKDDDGLVTHYVGTHVDITQRKQTEEQLSKLAQAVEQSSESIVITNLDAEIEYVNNAFLQTSGYPIEEVMGQNLRFLQSGKTTKQTYAELWESLIHGQTWKGEFINKRKNGQEYIDFATITAIRQPDGHITHYVAVQEDISEKKRIASELELHRNHLEQLVSNRTAELESARSVADAANKAKSAFLTNMSHEIRTPMNAIIGLTYILKKSSLLPEQQNRLEMIDTAAQHLLSIINDILDLSKIESGRMILNQTDFDLMALLEHTCSLVDNQARSKGISIGIECNDVPQWMHGDAVRLSQALLNYVANAVKFTEKGEVYLRVKLLEETKAGLLLRFEVQDTGIGILEENQHTLFEAFTQADVSNTRKYGGTGLGLSITENLVKLMGGEVGVESTLDQGSLFWFTVRLKPSLGRLAGLSSSNTSNSELLLRQHHMGARLLLVEDCPLNQEVTLDFLQSVGMAVDTAKSGRSAIDKVRMNAYDLVLMDLQMPEMDGIQATREIRAVAGLELLPIIAMTANAFTEHRSVCLSVGMNDFIAKPVDPETLYSKLLYWLSRPELKPGPVDGAGQHYELMTDGAGLPPVNPELPSHLLSISGLDVGQGLAYVKGDAAKYKHLLSLFTDLHSQDMKRIQAWLADGNVQEARRLTHELTNASAIIGANRVSDLAAQLESAFYIHAPTQECMDIANLCDNELTQLSQAVLNALQMMPV